MYNFSKGQEQKDPYNFSMEPQSNKNAVKPVKAAPAQSQLSKNDQSKSKAKSKLLPSDYQPKRFGLKYDPPTIILEYLASGNGKLYHHKMKLLKLKPDTPTKHVLEYIKKKHYQYFQANKIPDTQISVLIDKMKSRLLAKGPTQVKRPETASTMASSQSTKFPSSGPQIPAKQQKQINKEFDDYGMGASDLGSKNSKQPISKIAAQIQPTAILRQVNQVRIAQNVQVEDEEDDEQEDYEDEYEDGDEYYDGDEDQEEEIDEEEYNRIYKQMNYNNLDMNKLTAEELNEHKAVMDQIYKKNIKRPGDPGYQYDVQKNFKPTQDAEWDMEDDEDADIV